MEESETSTPAPASSISKGLTGDLMESNFQGSFTPGERPALLRHIVQQAVALLKAKSGGIYEYAPERQELVILVDFNRPEQMGKVIQVGQGMAGRLVQFNEPYLIVDDYNDWNGRAEIYQDQRPFQAVLEVLLEWNQRILGVLYVDDVLGRKFTPEDARRLSLFAEQAAITLAFSDLVSIDQKKLERLELLSRATTEIMGNLGTTSLDDRLDLITRHTSQILEAETCGIFLVKRPGNLTLSSSFGHSKEGFPKGLELPIRSIAQGGLTGHIAAAGELFNLHGDALDNHFAARHHEHNHTPSGKCFSLLAIPLKTKTINGERLVGLLRADNKKNPAGQALPSLAFNAEDEWIIRIFAEAVVVAIESAGLVAQLSEQKDRLERLLESSPNGIVAADLEGRIILFNQRACQILEYSDEEFSGLPLTRLYWDAKTPTEIGQRLREDLDERINGYETFVESRAPAEGGRGEKIPIRLSATGLYDADGRRIGSVGYFEDLRPLREAEKHLRLLKEGIDGVSQANSLSEGLFSLSRTMVEICDATFCHVLLLAADGRSMEAKACYPVEPDSRHSWKSDLGRAYQIPTLSRFFQRKLPIIIRRGKDQKHSHILDEIGLTTRLAGRLQSALVVPIIFGDKRLGVCVIGDLRSWEVSPFTIQEKALTQSLANQTAMMISRLREIERNDYQLQILFRISDFIRTAEDLDNILISVLTGITAGYGLCFNRAGLFLISADGTTLEGKTGIGFLNKYEAERDWADHHRRGMEHFEQFLMTMKANDLKLTPVGERLASLQLPIRPAVTDVFSQVLDTHQPLTLASDGFDRLPPDFTAAFQPSPPLVILPLMAGDNPVGLLVADNKFTQAEITTETLQRLSIFVNSAAVAIFNHNLINQARSASEKIRASFEASSAVVSSQPSEKVLFEIVNRLKQAAGASWVSIILVDSADNLVDYYSTGLDQHVDLKQIVRPDGFTRRVLDSGQPAIIKNARNQSNPPVNNHMFLQADQAAACLPLSLEGRQIGVMWIHYSQPQPFPDYEMDALRLYANHAAIVYDSARRLELLANARNTARVAAEFTLKEDLKGTLDAIARGTREALACDVVTLYTYDEVRDEFGFPPAMAGVLNEAKVLEWGYVGKDSVPRRVLNQPEEIYVTGDSMDDAIMRGGFTAREGICATAGIQLKVAGNKIGVMFVNHRKPHSFSEDEITNILLFAMQASVAIHKAQLFTDARKRAAALEGLYRAGKAVTRTLQLDETLREVAVQALHIVGGESLPQGSFSHVALKDGPTLRFIAASSPEALVTLWSNVVEINLEQARPVGITGSAVLQRCTLNVADVKTHPEYIRTFPQVRSQLSVPLICEEEVIGVLTIEHPWRSAFTTEDVQNIELLAAQAAVAIKNARQYDELKKTKGLVGASTALAWMGMAKSHYRHSIEGHAINIRNNVTLFRDDLGGHPEQPEARRLMEKRMQVIESEALKIIEKEPTPPLSSEEGVETILINELISERMTQLWDNPEYQVATPILELSRDDSKVRLSPEWMRRALDILVDNAVEAMQESPVKELRIQTRRMADRVEITIQDTGRGIPEAVQRRLFKVQIEKEEGEPGFGMGLLIVQAILQAYNGEIHFAASQPGCTRFVIFLPAQE